jgi:predicted ATPase
MRNFITGPNESGKTILTKLVGSVAYPHLIAGMSQHTDVDMTVRWYDPQTCQLNMAGRSGNLRQVLDGREVPYVARPFKTIMPSMDGTGPTDLRSLAQMFDLSTTAMKATLEDLITRDGAIKEVKVVEEDVEFIAVMDGKPTRSSSLRSASPAQRRMFILEVAAAHAGFHASVEPTILLLDEPFFMLHARAEAKALDRLDRACGHAQLTIVTHSTHALSARSDWNKVILGKPRSKMSFARIPVDVTIESSRCERQTAGDEATAPTMGDSSAQPAQ